MKTYTALIIDLKKSRSYKLEERNSIQNYIALAIQCLNGIFSDSLAKDVGFSAGDEIQGLFLSPESAYLYLRLLYMTVFPVEIRAGLGIGEWNVVIENASTTAQDGPAFHNARHAIENIKDTLGYSVLLCSGKEADLYLNALINASFMLTSNQSEYQNEIMLLSEMLYPIDYRQAMNHKKINRLFELAEFKSKINYYKKSRLAKKYLFEKLGFIDFKPMPIDAADDGSVLYVASGKKIGMNTRLAEILNISRQSLEKTIKAANIVEVRNLTITILNFMDKYLQEGAL